MSGDVITVAEIVEHAYACGAVKVTNYCEFDGAATETWEIVDGEPTVTYTERYPDTTQVDDIRASFPNGTRVAIKLRFGIVGVIRVAPGPGEYFDDTRVSWPDVTDWREILTHAGAQP